MDSRRKRILFQLRLLDDQDKSNHREGRPSINYDDSSTEALENFYNRRLTESLDSHPKETEAEKKRKERMVLWRNAAALMGCDFVLKNYTPEKFQTFWKTLSSAYPELTAFIHFDQLKTFVEELRKIECNQLPYAQIFTLLQEKNQFEDMLYKSFPATPSDPSQTDGRKERNPVDEFLYHASQEEASSFMDSVSSAFKGRGKEKEQDNSDDCFCPLKGCDGCVCNTNEKKEGKKETPSFGGDSIFLNATSDDISKFIGNLSGSSDGNPFVDMLSAYINGSFSK